VSAQHPALLGRHRLHPRVPESLVHGIGLGRGPKRLV
jgi:hypothetical protein